MTSLGVKFSANGVDIDESVIPGEAAADMVQRLAREKACALPASLPVLGADTIVVCDEQILGKPATKDEAFDMLTMLSGRAHRVLTAVAIKYGDALLANMSDTQVEFRDINKDEIQQYWQSGEPVGKAGAYAIQGRAGVFVRSIAGSYSGVVGLPVFETAELLEKCGINVLHYEESH